MPELVLPTTRLHAAFVDCRDDWGPGLHEDGFASEMTTTSTRRLGRVLGGIALRHHFDNDLGHIGYGVRPSARRRGLATWALGQMLVEAQQLGLDRVLLVCESDNVASMKTIESNGGVREPDGTGEVDEMRRYWIELS